MKRTLIIILLLQGLFTAVAQINTDRVIAIGRNALYYDDYVLAIQYFNSVIKAKPWLDQPYFYRAVAKLNLDDYSGAEDDCNLALQQNPFMTRAYFARGIARHSQGKYDLALEDYRKGLELRPKERPMMKNIAIAYIQKKDYEKAKEHFNELITAFPKDADNYMARGSLYMEAGDTIAALADYNKSIELDPYFAPSYGNRAILYFQKGDMQQALTDLSEAIRLSPREEGYYINRGLVRYHTNDLRGAMSDYDHVIAMNSNSLIARFNRGLLRFQVGDYNNAIEDFNTVITIEPDNYMAYYNRALLQSSVGAYREAIKDYDVILDQYPNFLPGYYSRSEAKRMINDISGAEKDYWFAMELERTHGNLPSQLAVTTTQPDDSVTIDDKNKKDMREESDKNINKFNQLVVYNKEDEQKSKYQSEIRGRVQDRNITINIEPQFILTYYEKPGKLNESVNYSRTLSAFNDRMVLRWRLIITNQEAALNEFQINTHFESMNEYSAKIEQNETNADYYFGRGIDFMLVQDFSEAIANFDLAIQLDPSYTLAYFNRAAVRYKQFDYEFSNTTQDELTESINIPYGVNRNIGIGMTPPPASNQRETRAYLFDMIIRDYTTVIQQDPSFTYAYFNRANLRCIQKDFRAAIPDYNEAIRRNPEFAEAYFNRGLARLSQGDATGEDSGIADISKAGELGIIKAYNIIKRMTSN